MATIVDCAIYFFPKDSDSIFFSLLLGKKSNTYLHIALVDFVEQNQGTIFILGKFFFKQIFTFRFFSLLRKKKALGGKLVKVFVAALF